LGHGSNFDLSHHYSPTLLKGSFPNSHLELILKIELFILFFFPFGPPTYIASKQACLLRNLSQKKKKRQGTKVWGCWEQVW
jgi:hypothetical protein